MGLRDPPMGRTQSSGFMVTETHLTSGGGTGGGGIALIQGGGRLLAWNYHVGTANLGRTLG